MDKIVEILIRKESVIVISVLAIVMFIALFLRQRKKKKYKTIMAEFVVHYNSLKSVPLSFKLNKAVAIARLDGEAMKTVTRTKDDFDLCQSNLKEISTLLADTEDLIQMNKMKTVKISLADINNLLALAETQVGNLNTILDTVLEKESAQRAEVTRLKDAFRSIKMKLQEKNASLSFCWDMVEVKILNCEKKFTTFEEWMYASEFDKASEVLENIQECLNEFGIILSHLPRLLQEARGIIPNMIEDVARNYVLENKKGVYLQHLEIERNLEVIQDTLKEDLGNLKSGNIENISAHCEDYKIRLSQLQQQIEHETASFAEMDQYRQRAENLIENCSHMQKYIDSTSQDTMIRFGLSDVSESIEAKRTQTGNINLLKNKIVSMMEGYNVPASTILISLKELVQDAESLQREFVKLKEQIEIAREDEEHAGEQLLKLQLIMNEMQVKIRKNRLPSISDSYQDDLDKAYEYVRLVEGLLNETPLNGNLLNTSLDEAIDFICQLYRDVNNLVGMAVMVENTIVFGNRYRSSYAEIDSELTRAELCYRNGEYTQALTIAIAIIEKIFPNNSEQKIKENAQSGK